MILYHVQSWSIILDSNMLQDVWRKLYLLRKTNKVDKEDDLIFGLLSFCEELCGW